MHFYTIQWFLCFLPSYLTVNGFRFFFSFLKIQLMGFAPRLALKTFFISWKSIFTPTWEFKRVILRQIAPNVAHCNSLHDYGHFILLVTFISRSWWCRRRASTASLASSPRKRRRRRTWKKAELSSFCALKKKLSLFIPYKSL